MPINKLPLSDRGRLGRMGERENVHAYASRRAAAASCHKMLLTLIIGTSPEEGDCFYF